MGRARSRSVFPLTCTLEVSLDCFHAFERLDDGLDGKSPLFLPFKTAMADAVLLPVPDSLARVMVVLRRDFLEYAPMPDAVLAPIASRMGKENKVLQRFVPAPAVVHAKCAFAGWIGRSP